MLWPDAFFESQILGEDQCGKVALILEEPFWYPVWNGKYHYIWCLHFQELRPLYCIRRSFSKAPGSLLMPKPAERTVSFGQSGGGWLRINGRSGWSAWQKKQCAPLLTWWFLMENVGEDVSMVRHPAGFMFGSKENLFLDGELQHLHIGDLGIACMPLDAKKKQKHADSEMRCKAYFLLVIQLRWKSEVFSCLCSRFRKNDV